VERDEQELLKEMVGNDLKLKLFEVRSPSVLGVLGARLCVFG
jgi:hypothetical protein